jgi:hypothetical protein
LANLLGSISPTEIKMNAPIKQQHTTGYRLLDDPRLNKGTAFTEAERRKYRPEGLLPPAVTSIDLQVARQHSEIANLDSDLQKYLVLSDLQARNETLYYAVLMSHPARPCPWWGRCRRRCPGPARNGGRPSRPAETGCRWRRPPCRPTSRNDQCAFI